MTLRKIQESVDAWIKSYGVRYFDELTNFALLAEEVGEVARIMARKFGEQSEKQEDVNKELSDELTDVLFVVVCIANQTGIDLTKAFKRNLEKKKSRDSNRHHNNTKLK
jgi:NTP pyrophosphatase (non-canonical NTP hydrolase)